MAFIILWLTALLFQAVRTASVLEAAYTDDCQGCLGQGFEFCAPAVAATWPLGACCSNVEFATDYCHANTECSM